MDPNHPKHASMKEWDKFFQRQMFNAGCTCIAVLIVLMWIALIIIGTLVRYVL